MSVDQLRRPPTAGLRPRPRVTSATLKVVMAVTGSVFIVYVLVHMVGNLKIFLGAEQLDHYAAALRTLFVPIVPRESVLWAMRIVLVGCLVVHVVAAGMLTRRVRAATGSVGRQSRLGGLRSFTSRTMLVSGIVIGVFLVFHVLDLTLGVVAGEQFRHPEVIGDETVAFATDNLVDSLRRPWNAALYVVANLVLGAHLLHGGVSVAHDLGVTGHRARRGLVVVLTVVAVAVVVGNVAIPLAVLTGVVP